MKKVRGMTNRIIAMLMSGMLGIGAVPGTVLASDIPDDIGQTSEIAAEVPEGPDTEKVSVEAYDEDAVAQEEEAEVQYYTVTLDANGGYFENEWDDVLGETVEQEEVVEKRIPVGETVDVVPVFTETDQDGQLIQTMAFAGWSLEKDGELITKVDEEYAPVDNCVLYAVWRYEDAAGDSDAVEGTSENESEKDSSDLDAPDTSNAEEEADLESEIEEAPTDEIVEDENARDTELIYTVTFDANGGYFENERDDVLGEYVERTEILNKVVPAGESIASFPVCTIENSGFAFSGWSLERDGEPFANGYDDYYPEGSCKMYAKWEAVNENVEKESSSNSVDSDKNENDTDIGIEKSNEYDESVHEQEQTVIDDVPDDIIGNENKQAENEIVYSERALNANETEVPVLVWNGHTYRVIRHTASFADAKEECESIGGHLAVIMSAEENAALTEYLCEYYAGGSYMIGLYDENGAQGQWDTWVTGEKVTYENWGKGQPDWDGQNICAINTTASSSYGWDVGEWDNGWDGDYHFICEWDYILGLTMELSSRDKEKIYTGSEIKPIPTVRSREGKILTIGKDYTLSYENNINPGIATITAAGIGDYAGQSAEVEFRIKDSIKAVLSQNLFYFGNSSDEQLFKPSPIVTCGEKYLEEKKDYTLQYKNNTSPGKAVVTVTGIGEYSGEIVEVPFYLAAVSRLEEAYEYTGEEIVPVFSLTADKQLTDGTDYTVSYRDNITVGPECPHIIVTGIGTYKGVLYIPFTIKPKKVTQVTSKTGAQREINVKFEDHPCSDGYIIKWDFQDKGGKDAVPQERTIVFNTKSVEGGGKNESFDYSVDADCNGWCEYHGDSMPRANRAVIRVCAYKDVQMPDGTINRVMGDYSDELNVPTGNQVIINEFWGFENQDIHIWYSSFLKMWAPEKAAQIFRSMVLKREDRKFLEGYFPFGQNCPTYVIEPGFCAGMCNLALSLITSNDSRLYYGNKDINDISNVEAIKNTYNGGMSLYDALQYVQLMNQLETSSMAGSQDLNKIYQYIEDVQNNEAVPLVFYLGPQFSHAIVPIGICEEEETADHSAIIVYDPNHPNDESRRFYLKKDSSGAYTGWEYSFNSEETWSSEAGHEFGMFNYTYSNVQFHLQEIKNGTFIKNQENRDKLFMLVHIPRGDENEDNKAIEDFYHFLYSGDLDEENPHFSPIIDYYADDNQDYESSVHKFWVTSDKRINLKGVPAGTLVAISSNNHSLTLTSAVVTDMEISISDDETGIVNLNPYDDGKCTVEFSYQDSENGALTGNHLDFNMQKSCLASISKIDNSDIRVVGISELEYQKTSGTRGDNSAVDINNLCTEIDHSFTDWKTDIEPKCEVTGFKSRTCVHCGKSEVELLPALEHIWNTECSIDAVPTDNQPGAMSVHCRLCDAIKKNSVTEIPALNDKDKIVKSGSCGEGVTWTLYEGGLLFISGTGAMTYSTETSSYWNEYKEDIKTVIINDGVTSIATMAFMSCTNMSSVRIPEGITSIGSDAFRNCSALASVTIPSTVTHILLYSFYECTSLESVKILEGIERIDSRAFYGCNNLRSVTLPSSLIEIAFNAFSECSNLTDVIVSEDLTRNFYSAFKSTPWISSMGDFVIVNDILWRYVGKEADVVIPSGVKTIEKGAFESNTNLKSVTIPTTVNSIEVSAFEGCNGLVSVVIPEGVKRIGSFAFYHCTSLENVEIKKGVKEIGHAAFMGCNSLNTVSISDGVTSIENSSFYGCTNLTKINIPESVTSIENLSFYGCTNLTKINIPESVTSIGASSFYGCTNLTKINIPESVTSIGAAAFLNCDNLTNITVPSSVNSIGNHAFYHKEGNEYTPLRNLIISCFYNSNAEHYAKENGIAFRTFIIDAVVSVPDQLYAGKALKPEPVVSIGDTVLLKNVDYTVTYDNNTNVGTATLTITGKGNYAGTNTATFKITKAAQSITATAKASTISVGKTTTVSLTGNKGSKSFKSSDTAVATVDKSTGKVTAKKVGTVKITATSAATANYKAATKTVTIKVVPAATASLTAANQATGIRLTWKKVTGANGYKVYRGSTLIKTITSGSTVTYADTAANTNGTKYTYKVVAKASTGDSTLSKSVAVYRVARPAITSATNSAASKMTVKWGKNAKANGYQIQYSLSSSFASGNKAVTVASASTVSRVIGSLTKGKTYYVRIRTYKTVGSAKYWSEWSAKKSVKISK